MWEIFEKLCAERDITPYKVAKDTGIIQSTLYNWKIRNNLADELTAEMKKYKIE